MYLSSIFNWLFEKNITLNNRLLSKPAATSAVRGNTERRTAVYTLVHEDLSTVSTKQFADAVGFGKKSNDDNPLPRDCWFNILKYLQKDEAIKTLRLVSTEMHHVTTLTEAGKSYYQRKNIFLIRMKKNEIHFTKQ